MTVLPCIPASPLLTQGADQPAEKPANPFDHLEDLGQFARDTKAARRPDPDGPGGSERDLDDLKPDTRERFPCERCGGSGVYTFGYINRQRGPCRACKGVGSFVKSRQDRETARVKAKDRKAARLDATKGDFEEGYPGLIEFVRGAASWSEFARSMLEGFEKYGSLTEKQAAAALRMRDKVNASKAERAVEREAAKVEVDLSSIRAMFDAAAKTGLRKPRYLAEGLSLSLAPPTGKNPGAIYVKSDAGEYVGKVLGTTFQPLRSTPDSVRAALDTIAADPKGAAVRYGRLTGRCSCCGRTLTDPVSVANGIGPICEAKWGL